MPHSKLSRREFSTWLGGLGVGWLAMRRALAATPAGEPGGASAPASPAVDSSDDSGSCSELSAFEAAITWDDNAISYWVDGLHYSTTDLPSRGYLAILLKFQQQPTAYVDKVVLTDGSDAVLEGRYFDATDKMSAGYPPYLIYNNLDLTVDKLFLFVQIRQGNTVTKYRYVLAGDRLKRSTLNSLELPVVMRKDLVDSHAGVVSNVFQFKTILAPAKVVQHNVKARLKSISPTSDFELEVSFLHDDVAADAYNRYFFVTDPAGRLLGIHKRNLGDSDSTAKVVTIKALTEAERNQWGLTTDRVAKITDCPYIMVFVDDVKDCIAKTTIWLR